MAYIAFASAKGSPGVTTAVAAMAATWPADRDLLVAELDPAGGDLVVRLDLASEPGLVSLAAAGRRQLGADTLHGHTQMLPVMAGDDGSRRRILVGPVSADQATASLSALRGGIARVLDEIDVDVLVDCGRLDPGSAATEVATEADLLVMVARPVVAEVHHLAARLTSVRPKALSLLLVGERPYSVTEVAATVGASALGTLGADPRAAAVLAEGHPNAARLLRRSRLLRDARALAEGLGEWLGTGPGTGADDVAPTGSAGAPPSVGAPAQVTAPAGPPRYGPPHAPPPGGSSPRPPGPPPASAPPATASGGSPSAPRPPAPRPSAPRPSAPRPSAPPASPPTTGPPPSAPPPSAPPVPVRAEHAPDTRPPLPPPVPPTDAPGAAPPADDPPPRGPALLRSAVSGRGRGSNDAPPKHFRRDAVEEPR